MAKAPSAVIGIDLGQHSLKAVHLVRKGADRIVVTHFAVHPLAEPIADAERLAAELKALFKEMGAPSRPCVVAISSPEAIIRIIEQPETPTNLLREALRLNGMSLLNQDCRSFVLDCDLIPSADAAPAGGSSKKCQYLVGGAPRTLVTQISQAFAKLGSNILGFQLAPVSVFNAFAFAHREIFTSRAFFLVDIGHNGSTVVVGTRRELVLVRSIDCGGRAIMETLTALSGESAEMVSVALEHDDELMIENARMAVVQLTREIASSIGFFEGRREEAIDRVFVSGGMAKSSALLKVMTEEVRLPCEAWNALATCEMGVASSRAATFNEQVLDLTVASGAATEFVAAQ